MRLFSKSNVLVCIVPWGSKLQKASRELEPVLHMFTLRRRSLGYVTLPFWGADSRSLLAFGHMGGKINR